MSDKTKTYTFKINTDEDIEIETTLQFCKRKERSRFIKDAIFYYIQDIVAGKVVTRTIDINAVINNLNNPNSSQQTNTEDNNNTTDTTNNTINQNTNQSMNQNINADIASYEILDYEEDEDDDNLDII